MNTEKITSKENAKLKVLKKLGQKKYRDKYDQFVVENWKIIIDSPTQPIELYATEAFLKNNSREIAKLDCPVLEITEQLNKTFSNLETAPGVAALYKKPKNKINFDTPIIYLNGVADPGNVGTILRSALAFGIKDIVLDELCADVFNPKAVQAAKDSIFKLNIEFDHKRTIFRTIKKNMPVISTRVEQGENLGKMFEYDTFCIVLGSESHGVNKAILERSDAFVRIEMSPDIESINVSAAAAIIFHEIFHARR